MSPVLAVSAVANRQGTLFASIVAFAFAFAFAVTPLSRLTLRGRAAIGASGSRVRTTAA